MNRILLAIFLILQIPYFIVAQNEDTFEIQAEKVEANSNSEIQIFYEKFNAWIASIEKDSANLILNEKRMVNNFIIFSQDGLIMKDLSFHSTESCKKQILASLPKQESDKVVRNWLYVSLETQVNKRDLIEILKFLKEENIDYQFGKEDEFVPKVMKN